LSGYGGTSNLILEGVKKLSDSYMVTVNGLTPGKESKIVFSVRNTGSRAAFVKAVGFKDSQKKVLLDPKILRIFPDKFVLKERTQEVSIKICALKKRTHFYINNYVSYSHKLKHYLEIMGELKCLSGLGNARHALVSLVGS
jgi:hypothetical protein